MASDFEIYVREVAMKEYLTLLNTFGKIEFIREDKIKRERKRNGVIYIYIYIYKNHFYILRYRLFTYCFR